MTPSDTATDARALTESALVQIHEASHVSADPDDFLGRADAIVARPENQLLLPVPLGTPDTISPSQGSGGIDSDNAPRVHEFLGEMDRANAADPRLWSYLALVTYRSYMEARWPLDEVQDWRARARTRWLMAGVTRGKLVRHGIARLWWITHLTYDPEGRVPMTVDDPYALTRLVFANEDRVLALFDREVGAIPSVARAVLAHIATGDDHGKDKHVRELMKVVTLMYGYRDLGILADEDVEDLVAVAATAATPSS